MGRGQSIAQTAAGLCEGKRRGATGASALRGLSGEVVLGSRGAGRWRQIPDVRGEAHDLAS
jgi:hypothetical protein